MSWVTKRSIGRQGLFVLSKENDYTINLKGSEWKNPKFFITIKSIKYPHVLKSIKFDIKKLSILNSYKIDTVISGIVEDKKTITRGEGDITVYANDCHGFKIEWGGGTETSSWYECEYDIKITNNSGMNEIIKPIKSYSIYRYDSDLYGGLGYGEFNIEDFNNNNNYVIRPTVNGTRFSYAYSWNFVLTKYIDTVYTDNDVELLVVVVENTDNPYDVLNLKDKKSSWIDTSKITFKSQVIKFDKVDTIDINLPNYTKGVTWGKSNIAIGSSSLYTMNKNMLYHINYTKHDDNKYTISNKSEAYPNRVTLTSSNFLYKYSRTSGNGSSSYTIRTKEYFNLYIWVEQEVLNQSGSGYSTIEVYNNGIHIGTLKNEGGRDYNYIAKAQEWGRSYSWYYSTYYLNVKPDISGVNNITAKMTWADGSTMSLHVYLNEGTNYSDSSRGVVTYNDTLIYAFESKE